MVDKTTTFSQAMSQQPDLSLVLPCYNEENSIRNTATRLVEAFQPRNVCLQLVLVDNGSSDSTGKIIDQLIAERLPVTKAVVERNQGYGHGVLEGLRFCRGRCVGFMCVDEQVEAADVVRLYEIAAKTKTPKLFKVRRRFRLEGLVRRFVSTAYNLLTTLLFGSLSSMDLNANPKFLPCEYIEAMNLRSKDWFLDAEVMIKAKRMGLPIYEMNVFSHMRAEGASNVRPSTCWEFIANLLSHRFGSKREELAIRPLASARGEREAADSVGKTRSPQ